MNTIKNSYEYYEGNQSLLNMLNKKKQGNPLINQIIINNQNAYQKKMESMGIYKATGTDKYSKVTKASNSLLDAIDNVTKDELYQQEKEKEYDKTPLLKSVSNFITTYNYSGSVFKTKYLSFYNESMLRVERGPLHHCNQGYAA